LLHFAFVLNVFYMSFGEGIFRFFWWGKVGRALQVFIGVRLIVTFSLSSPNPSFSKTPSIKPQVNRYTSPHLKIMSRMKNVWFTITLIYVWLNCSNIKYNFKKEWFTENESKKKSVIKKRILENLEKKKLHFVDRNSKTNILCD
jgi:hypothetical protein